MPAIVSMDSNNNCKVIVENCPPYDKTIETNDLIGVIEIEAEKLIPLTDHAISSVCAGIHAKLPKIHKPTISQDEIARQCHLQVPNEFREQYINILSITKSPSALTSTIWGRPETTNTKFT
jgi:NAD-dependent dihydropyrimidine dehydrogenase PreA subunit